MSATVTISQACSDNNSTAASMRSWRREGRFAALRGVSSAMMSSIVATDSGNAESEPGRGARARATKTATKRPAHRPSRRLQIVEAAIQVFAREGYVEASVEDIANAAG